MQSESKALHDFILTTFLKPTKCAVCDKLLLGILKQGYRCSGCDLPVHSRCRAQAFESCSCIRNDRNLVGNPLLVLTESNNGNGGKPLTLVRGAETSGEEILHHQFKVKTFSSPTYCFVCKELLIGLYKQGIECDLCKTSCHKKCLGKMKAAGNLDSCSCTGFVDVAQGASFGTATRKSDTVRSREIVRSIESKFDSVQDSLFSTLDEVEKSSFSNVVVNKIKSGTQHLSKDINSLTNDIENTYDKGKVSIDEDVKNTIEALAEATSMLSEGGKFLGEAVNDARCKGVEYCQKTSAYKRFVAQVNETTDPELRDLVVSAAKGVTNVLDESYSSMYEIGRNIGKSSIRVSSHLGGEEAEQTAKHAVASVSNVVETYSSVSNATSAVYHAKRLVVPKSTTLDEAMYSSVFEALNMEKLVLTPAKVIQNSCPPVIQNLQQGNARGIKGKKVSTSKIESHEYNFETKLGTLKLVSI